MYFRLYKDAAHQWRWTLYSANHRKVADSAESYINKQDCLNGIALVKQSSNAPVHE